MEGGVYEHINNLKSQMAGLTRNPIVDRFNDDLCRQIDRDSATDRFIREKREVILQNLSPAGVDHTDHIQQAFSAYNEIEVLLYLRTKCDISDVKKEERPTPDFLVQSKAGGPVNLELYTMFFADSKYSIKAIQDDWLQVSIELEEIRTGKRENDPPWHCQNAFRKYEQKGDITRKQIINTLHNKASKTAKQRQMLYQGNPSILFVDLGAIDYHFFLQEGLPAFVHPYQSALVSGLFWHLCFGKIGERIMESPEFPGKPCLFGEIDKQGILYEHPSIKAMIIGMRWANEVRMIGLHTATMNDLGVLETLAKTCNFVNNDLNTNYAEIGYDPRTVYIPQS